MEDHFKIKAKGSWNKKKDESKVIVKLWEDMSGIMLLSWAHVKNLKTLLKKGVNKKSEESGFI